MSRSAFEKETAGWEKVCFVCGKNFIAAPYHIYRERGKWFCTYHCKQIYIRQREEADKVKDIKLIRKTRYRRKP